MQASQIQPDEPPASRGTVLVFTAELLPYSETFVRDHVASLRRFPAILVGAKKVAGLPTDGLATAVLPEGKLSRALMWFGGVSPALDRIVDEHGVSLIHAHFADAGARIARYARRRGLPLVVTLHGADVLRRPQRSLRQSLVQPLWRDMLSVANLFLAVSDHLAAKARQRGVPADKLRRHYLGIPLADRMTRRQEDVEVPIILFVGRLVEKKGLTYLIDAARLLDKRGKRFRVRVLGDGPLLDQLRAQADGLDHCVEFAGRRTPEQVREELQAAHIFCMPSVEASDGDNEGLPIVSLEGQAAGLPLVAFDQGPVPEAIEAEVTGLLTTERSPEGLADSLERLIDDPGLRARMGEGGRQRVEQRFDIHKQSRELEDIYDELLSPRVGARE